MSDIEYPKTRKYRDKSQENWCGIGIEQPKLQNNIGVIFRTAAVLGAADFLFTIGEKYNRPHDDVLESFRHVPVWNFKDFDDLLERKPLGCDIIGVEQDKRAKPLNEYQFPQRCCILFGSEGDGLSRKARESCRELVYIPTALNVSMNVSSCAAIIMADRLRKMT